MSGNLLKASGKDRSFVSKWKKTETKYSKHSNAIKMIVFVYQWIMNPTN